MSKKRSTLEKEIQRSIEAALGAEPDLLLLRNSVGQARFMDGEGHEFFVPYGLGVGSPDLVGLLRVETPVRSVWHISRDDRADTRVTETAPLAIWFALEVKVPGEIATPEQQKVHAVWRRFGAHVNVVHSVEEARAALERARRIGA